MPLFCYCSTPNDEDEWLEKSLQRSEKADVDYKPSPIQNNTLTISTSDAYKFKEDPLLIVFESQLLKLFNICKCGSPVIDTTLVAGEGTQQRYKFTCLNGCERSWNSQPSSASLKGLDVFSLYKFYVI